MKRLLATVLIVLLPASTLFGQDVSRPSPLTAASPNGPITDLRGSGVTQHAITWNTTGTVSGGTCSLLGSLDGSTFGITIVGPQTVTTPGASAIITLTTTNYAQIQCSGITGGGTVTVRELGWQVTPVSTSGGGGGGGGGGNTTIVAPLGQTTMAASVSTVIASNQSAVPISAASLPLPTGAASSAIQTNGTAVTQISTTTGNVTATYNNGGHYSLDVNVANQPTFNVGTTGGLALNSTLTAFSGTIASGGVPLNAVLVGFQNSSATQMVPLKLDNSGNVPVSGSLTLTPNATFGSAAPTTGFMAAYRNGSNADYGTTDSNHYINFDLQTISAAATGPQPPSGSDSVVISPNQFSWTDSSVTISTGGTSQPLMTSNSSRHGFCIKNPNNATEQGIATAENIDINFTSAASDTAGTSFTLGPGESYCEGQSGQVTTEAINVVAVTTGHKIQAKYR